MVRCLDRFGVVRPRDYLCGGAYMRLVISNCGRGLLHSALIVLRRTSTPSHTVHLLSLEPILAMAGSKRNKIKKIFSPVSSPPPPIAPEDDELMDDLFAQLDSRDQTVQAESAAVITEMHLNQTVNTSNGSSEESKKHDSRARHKARQVRSISLRQH